MHTPRLVRIFFITVLLASPAVVSLLADDSLPAVKDLERQALHYRRNTFRTGRVVMISDETHGGKLDRRRFEYAFDGKSLFWQWRAVLDDGSLGPPSSVIVAADQKSFIEAIASNNPRVAVMRRPVVAGQFGDCYPIALDIRYLGMSADSMGVQCQFGMEGILNRADRKNLKLSRGTGELAGTWKIEGDLPDGQHLAVWLAPDKGMSVRHAEATARAPDGDYHYFTEVKLKRFERGGVWFPDTVHHWHTWNGGGPLDEQLNTVQEAEFNQPIDPAQFTYAGLNLRPGQPIIDQVKNWRAYYWDGEKVLPQIAGSDIEQLAPRRPWVHWFFGGLSAVLALLGVFLLLFHRRRQHA